MLRGIETEQFKTKTILSTEGKYNIINITNKETEIEMTLCHDQIDELIEILETSKKLIIES